VDEYEAADDKINFFRVIEASTDIEGTQPLMPTDTVMVIDGTAAMPSGTMVSPGMIARYGYLSYRVPSKKVDESMRAEIEGFGLKVNDKGEVSFSDGRRTFDPYLHASELMYHVSIQRADGLEEKIF
jgi:hypothetical protein